MGDISLHLTWTASIKESIFATFETFLYIHEAVVFLVTVIVQQIIKYTCYDEILCVEMLKHGCKVTFSMLIRVK